MDKFLEAAIDRKNRSDFAGAAKVLEDAVAAFPGSGVAHWLLGSIQLWELAAPEQAIPHFEAAIAASPKSEKASLGLFHSLWELDRIDEALEELKRFQLLTNWSCRDYREIMAEIIEKQRREKARRKPASSKKAKLKA